MSSKHLLRRARQQRGWSQAVVARHLQTTAQQVSRWERGETHPSPHFCAQLCLLFDQDAEGLGLISQDDSRTENSSQVSHMAVSVRDNQFTSPILISDSARPRLDTQPEYIIGREYYLASLLDQLKKGVSCVLFGLPGIGKSTLAHLVVTHPGFSDAFPSGFCWIGLGPSSQVTSELSRLALLLGVPEYECSKEHSREDWSRLLHQALEGRRMLLIIDDAWSVDDVLPFLIGGSGVAHLITTRLPWIAFALPSANPLPVPELSSAESLTLLTTLVPALASMKYAQLDEVLHSMGGLPLAVTLLGRYLRTQTIGGQPRRLVSALSSMTERANRLQLVVPHPPATLSFSQHTKEPWSLATIIRFSDEHLSSAARDAFYSLSMFPAKPARFSEQAALAVSGQDDTVLDQLLDAGLLEGVEPGWYVMHQTIADYGRQSLTSLEPGVRLVAYALHFIEDHKRDFSALTLEYPILLAALEITIQQEWHKQLFELTKALETFWGIQCQYAVMEKYLIAALTIAQHIEDFSAQMVFLLSLGSRTTIQTNYSLAEQYLQQGLAIARQKEDREALLQFLTKLGSVAGSRGNEKQALTFYHEALVLASQSGNLHLQAMIHNNLGYLFLLGGHFYEAENSLRISLRMMKQVSSPGGICVVLHNLGDSLQLRGLLDEAHASYQEALTIAEEQKFLWHQCKVYPLLGMLARERGTAIEAQKIFEKGLVLVQQREGPQDCKAYLLVGLATVKLDAGKIEEASHYLLQAEKLAQTLNNIPLHVALACGLSKVLLAQHRYEDAQRRLLGAYNLVPLWQERALADVEYVLAQVAAAQGNEDDINYWGNQSLARFVKMQHAQAPKVRQWLDEILSHKTSFSYQEKPSTGSVKP